MFPNVSGVRKNGEYTTRKSGFPPQNLPQKSDKSKIRRNREKATVMECLISFVSVHIRHLRLVVAVLTAQPP